MDGDQKELFSEPSELSTASPVIPPSQRPANMDGGDENVGRSISKSNSVLSHKSIPFIGGIPLGKVRLVQDINSIREAQENQSSRKDGDHEHDRSRTETGDLEGTQTSASALSSTRASASVPQALRNGDAFIVLGCSPGFQIGCDTMAMTVQNTSQANQAVSGNLMPYSIIGLRDFTPGVHFVWVAPPGALSRQGYWFVTKPAAGTVRLKQWDNYSEMLAECASQFEARSLIKEIDALYPMLLSYGSGASTNGVSVQNPLRDPNAIADEPNIWPRLTSCISEPLLNRIMGYRRTPPSGDWLVSTTDMQLVSLEMVRPRSVSSRASFVFLFSHQDVDPYQLLASSKAGRDAAGAYSMAPLDTTPQILTLLDKSQAQHPEEDFVGDLQFTFLTGTLLTNPDCLEQWWHLVLKKFLRARDLMVSRPRLCRCFLQTLHAQFVYLDRHVKGGFTSRSAASRTDDAEDGGTGLFEIKPHGEARLQASLTAYKRHLNEALLKLGDSATPEQVAVGQAFADLEAWLWKYGWDLRSDYVDDTQDGDANGRAGCNDDDGDDDDVDVLMTEGKNVISQENRGRTKGHAARWQQAPELYNSDDDDDRPVLVQLDENGRQVDRITWDS